MESYQSYCKISFIENYLVLISFTVMHLASSNALLRNSLYGLFAYPQIHFLKLLCTIKTIHRTSAKTHAGHGSATDPQSFTA